MSTTAIKYDAAFAFKADKPVARRSGQRWSELEEQHLKEAFIRGEALEQISTSLQRPGTAVLSRLVDMRLLIRRDLGNYRYDYHVNDSLFIKHNFPNPYKQGQSKPNTQPIPDSPAARWPYPKEPVDSTTEPQPKEDTMATIIETKTFIDGIDASTVSDEQIFTRIAKIEAQIDTWNKIKTKPKKLEAKIAEAQQSINMLVAFVDGR